MMPADHRRLRSSKGGSKGDRWRRETGRLMLAGEFEAAWKREAANVLQVDSQLYGPALAEAERVMLALWGGRPTRREEHRKARAAPRRRQPPGNGPER